MENLKKIIDRITIKFLIVGAINTLIGAGVMFAFYNFLHLSYWISSASNYIIGSIISYLLNKNWTFQNKEKGYNTILRFVINIVICYILAYGITKPLIIYLLSSFSLSFQENIAMTAGLILFTLLNYFGQRFFAFRETSK